MKQGRASPLLLRAATALRPLRRLAVPLSGVALAVAGGLLAGWLATSLMLAPAPEVRPEATPAATDIATPPLFALAITVEALAPPEPPAQPMIVAGPAHAPAELALFFIRFAVIDNDAPASRSVLPGAPHGGADSTLLSMIAAPHEAVVARKWPGPPHRPGEIYLLLAAREPAVAPIKDARVLPGPPHEGAEAALYWLEPVVQDVAEGGTMPGPPHRPGELYLLLVTRAPGAEAVAEAHVLPGPPHTMPEVTLLLERFMAQTASTAAPVSPGSRDPGRFFHALPEPVAVAALHHSGPPHTMPEVALLYGALERQREAAAPQVELLATWWLAEANSNAALERLPLPQERPEVPDFLQGEAEVAITESGPVRPIEPSGPAPADLFASPMIAIMIDDLGLNAGRSARVAALPGPLTMAFMPYGEGLSGQTQLASAAGHEIFLHLPMEPTDPTIDAGPHALLETLGPEELAAELAWNLDRFSGYVGVNNHMGSLLTQDGSAMAAVMAELHRRNLLFVDSVTAAGSVAFGSAVAAGIPAARRDVFLDNTPELEAVLAQLDHLEDVARSQGYAIGIGHPHDATIAALALWLPQAQARGVLLVPASRIIASRGLILAQHGAD